MQPARSPAFTSGPQADLSTPVTGANSRCHRPVSLPPPHSDLPSLAQLKILLQKHVRSEDSYGFPNLLGQKEPRLITADLPTSGCHRA